MAKKKVKNHEADISNGNEGTSGINDTYKKNQENRKKQIQQNQKKT